MEKRYKRLSIAAINPPGNGSLLVGTRLPVPIRVLHQPILNIVTILKVKLRSLGYGTTTQIVNVYVPLGLS